MQELIKLLNSSDIGDQLSALEVIKRTKANQYIPTIIQKIKDSNSDEFIKHAFNTLTVFNKFPDEIIEVAISNLASSSYYDARQILFAVGNPAVRQLIVNLKNKNESIQYDCAEILEKMYKFPDGFLVTFLNLGPYQRKILWEVVNANV